MELSRRLAHDERRTAANKNRAPGEARDAIVCASDWLL